MLELVEKNFQEAITYFWAKALEIKIIIMTEEMRLSTEK